MTEGRKVNYPDEQIRAAMAVKKLSMSAVAEASGLARQTVGLIANGAVDDLLLSSLSAIADAVGLDVVIQLVPRHEPVQEEREPAAALG